MNVGIAGIPVVHRELQVTGRAPAFYRHRTIVAALAILVGLLCIRFSLTAPAAVGRNMFVVFAWGVFLLCLLEGARSAADAISGERREGTLGLLFLTDLRPRDVVFGKLVSVSIRSLCFLLPVLPMFALPLLLGGVTGWESLRAMLTLVVTLFFALSAGLLASSLSVSSTAALAKTALVLLTMAIQPGLFFLTGQMPAASDILWISGPLAMMIASRHASFTSDPFEFWLAATVSLVASLLMLIATANFTRRDLLAAPGGLQFWHRWFQPRREYVAPWGETSDQSPAVWLAQRTLPGQRLLWILICLGLAACFAAGLFGTLVFAMVLQLCFGITLKLWIALMAPQSLHELRKSGALELILCTPLQPQSIVRGQVDCLFESFIGPAIVIAVGFPIFLAGGDALSGGEDIVDLTIMVPLGIIWFMYTLLDVHAVAYLGMWQGLSSSRIDTAVGKTAWYGAILPCLFVVIPVLGWVTLAFWPVIVMHWATTRLNRRFHEALIRS